MAMGILGEWHGTDEERDALNAALNRNCTCNDCGPDHCSAHAILKDQHILNRLIFVRRSIDIFLDAEEALDP